MRDLTPNHFSLERALQDIWSEPGFLTQEQKQLIQHCYDHGGPPTGEHELDVLYQAVTHCQGLSGIGDTQSEHWLTKGGQKFPDITSKYFHKVATNLHLYDGQLPDKFIAPLADFINQTRSHVATLNYDKLLYDALLDRDIVCGDYFTTKLVDGMTHSGFSSDTLERQFCNSFGYYLHLHGSPLFHGNNGYFGKYSRSFLEGSNSLPSKHIVLTHVRRKTAVISASPILSTYWSFLPFVTAEAKEIIIIGYSGLDKHLNDFLRINAKEKLIKIVEWEGSGELQERQNYWQNELGRNISVKHYNNILDFDDWD